MENDVSPARPAKRKNFFHHAATFCLCSPFIAILWNVILVVPSQRASAPVPPGSYDAQINAAANLVLAAFIPLLGIVAGTISLFGIRRQGAAGIVWKTATGLSIYVLLLLLAIPNFIRAKNIANQRYAQFLAAKRGTATPQLLSIEDKAALLEQVQPVQSAVDERDYKKLIIYAPSAVLKLYGRNAFERTIWSGMTQSQANGYQFTFHTDFGEPMAAYQTGNGLICLVPRMSLVQVQEKQVKIFACWVAVRENGDPGWKFIDGAVWQNNKQRLWQLYPELPDDMPLPEWKQEVVN
jgi:hypothetical protein